MTDDIKSIEKEAHRFLGEKDYQEASRLFSVAAGHYQKIGQHKQAALMFASAASSWGIKAGEKALFHHAAVCYEKAATEAEAGADFEYASMLYKHAGVCHERDLEFMALADCFYQSKECYRKYLSSTLFPWKKRPGGDASKPKFDLLELVKRFSFWFSLTFSSALWGHGERPQRTIFMGIYIILGCGLLYTQGHLMKGGLIIKPDLVQAVYFSTVNFIHVGYEAVVPVGINKAIAILEALISGVFIFPIYITGLCRRYLRFL